MRTVIAVLAVTFSVGSIVHAESLGDVAAREKEKRKGQKEGSVITETELANAKGRGVSMTYGGASAPAPAPAKDGEAKDKDAKADGEKPKTPEELAAEKVAAKQKEWQGRVDAENAAIAGIQAQIAAVEATPAAFNDMGRPAQLANLRAKLAAEQAKLDALQEEGRRGFY
jgi:hypothetical protein